VCLGGCLATLAFQLVNSLLVGFHVSFIAHAGPSACGMPD
jgi:hypothetical protein